MCAGWTAEAETRAGQVGRWGQEGGEQRVNFQALGVRFYEGIYEAVFPKKEKGKSCTEGHFPATVRGPPTFWISSQLMEAVPLPEPARTVDSCMRAASRPAPQPLSS